MTYNIAAMLIDAVDRRILALLRENARMSTALLGRQLGVSRTTVHSRIERLLARRVITGFTVRMGADQERDQIQAQVMIAAVQKVLARVEAALRALPEVRKLYSVSGQHEFIAIVVTDSVGEMDQLLDRIGTIEGVDRTESSIVLSTRIDR
ncbi:MAG TPA: Lrp/AsnC family transcriptional regulator [Steroidobacteraceae bacterium]|nr:Lrp/AsnC family transcriptional regulator [Steroidobacteraceae bacterium]